MKGYYFFVKFRLSHAKLFTRHLCIFLSFKSKTWNKNKEINGNRDEAACIIKKNWLHLHILEVLDNLGIMLPIS